MDFNSGGLRKSTFTSDSCDIVLFVITELCSEPPNESADNRSLSICCGAFRLECNLSLFFAGDAKLSKDIVVDSFIAFLLAWLAFPSLISDDITGLDVLELPLDERARTFNMSLLILFAPAFFGFMYRDLTSIYDDFFDCVSTVLLDFSNGTRRLPVSDADRRYAGTCVLCSALTTFDFECLIVEIRSGTGARVDGTLSK